MIQCPKCGADNMIGTIFCRSCGDKLNIDDLQPSTVTKAAKEARKSDSGVMGIIRNIIGLIVLGALLCIFGALFLTPPFTAPAALTKEQIKAAEEKVKTLSGKSLNAQVTLSPSEVNELARKLMLLTDADKAERAKKVAAGQETGMWLEAEDLIIDVLEDGRVKLVLKSTTWGGKITMYTMLIGQASASDGGLWFEPEEVYAGRLPMPIQAARDKMLDRFAVLISGKADFDDLKSKIKGLKITAPDKILLSRKKL